VIEVWWDILLQRCRKFTAKCASERILKIGHHLAKLDGKNIVAPLFRTRCFCGPHVDSSDIATKARCKSLQKSCDYYQSNIKSWRAHLTRKRWW